MKKPKKPLRTPALAPAPAPDAKPVPMVAMPRELAERVVNYLLDLPVRMNSLPLAQQISQQTVNVEATNQQTAKG